MGNRAFYQPPAAGRTAVVLVILIHGAALTALATARMEFTPGQKILPTIVRFIDPVTPPEVLPEPPREKAPPQQKSTIDHVVRQVITPIETEHVAYNDPPIVDPLPFREGETLVVPHTPVLPPDPVRVPATMDPRSELQPPYPSSEQRAGNVGSVAIRVVIGTDGRVKAVQKVRASSEAFYAATERHALRKWRFKPELLDGRPVESRKLITLRFTLDS